MHASFVLLLKTDMAARVLGATTPVWCLEGIFAKAHVAPCQQAAQHCGTCLSILAAAMLDASGDPAWHRSSAQKAASSCGSSLQEPAAQGAHPFCSQSHSLNSTLCQRMA